MNVDLTDHETAALLREPDDIIDRDRFPLTPPIRSLKDIRAKLRPEPDFANAQRHEVTLAGGMRGGIRTGRRHGRDDGRRLHVGDHGMAVVKGDMRHIEPVLTLTRGKSYILAIDNRTAWHHP